METEDLRLSLTPLRDDSATLSDRVAIGLGTDIIRGALTPGSRLPTEAELCKLYGVSRSVIRDAIRTLSGRGLVDVRQGLGMQITQPTDAPFAQALIILLMRSNLTIADVREARATIETRLAPLAAARGQESDWETMEGHLTAYGAAVARQSWSAARDFHLAFHYTLLQALRMPALTIILKPMQQIILLCSAPPQISGNELAVVWTPDDVALHRPIIDALRVRDADAVLAAMEAHFAPSFHRDSDHFKSYWSMPLRESQLGQALLKEYLSARPQSADGGSGEPGEAST